MEAEAGGKPGPGREADIGRVVDWYLHADDRTAVRALRHEVRDLLARHAEPGQSTADAELVVEELVGNAVRHAGGPIWVSLSWLERRPTLVVTDLGPGFTLAPDEVADLPDLAGEGGRGLFLVTHLADRVAVAAKRAGGTRVEARLPVDRAPSPSYDPAPSDTASLPLLSEARPEGGFNRESFLRALVVQLAQAVERHSGPGAAEAAVAQVGIDVGGQMEAEYRQARDVVGRLTPAQVADCLVRLKHAIDGAFYVVEVTDGRIVLGNHRCPFGDVVRRAPALCRMTSSVFGGIAARASDHGASVVLEERIAMGDPGCRVVVTFGPPDPETRPFAHAYRPPRGRADRDGVLA